MRKRLGFLLFLALLGGVLVVAAVLLGRPRDVAAGLYQKAGNLLKDGDYESALEAYGQVVARFPNSRWAGGALYTQGFILTKYLGRPAEAVEKFQNLASHYPKSTFRRDGLSELAGIYEKFLVRLDQAQAVYEQILQDYPDQPSVAAEAEVGIARCLVSKKDPSALQACEKVKRDFPSLTDVVAEASFLLAQAYQTINNDPKEALQRYQEVKQSYPETVWASKAENEIGLLYYQASEREKQTRVLLELPSSPGAPPPSSESLWAASVFPILLGSQAGLKPELLPGLSGEAFRFFYVPEAPALGSEIFYRNPFISICEALALPNSYSEFHDQSAARSFLKKVLFQRHPVVTSLAGPPPSWAIVIGADGVRSEFYLRDPYTKYRAYGSEEFSARWASPPAPRIIPADKLPPAGRTYPIFILKGSGPGRGLQGAITYALKNILKDLYNESPRKGVFASFAAYQALIQRLEARGEVPFGLAQGVPSEDYLQEAADWNSHSLPYLVACRQAAVAFLAEAAKYFQGPTKSHLEYASEDYGKVVELLGKVAKTLPTLEEVKVLEPKEKAEAYSHFGDRLLAAASLLRDALQYEHSAVSHLASAMGGEGNAKPSKPTVP